MRGCPHPVGHEGQTVDSAPKVRHHDQHRHRFGCGVVPRGHHHGRRRRPLFRLHPSARRQRGRADRRPVEQHTPRFDECHHPADRPGPNHPTGRNLAIDPAAGRHDRYDPRRDDADVRPGPVSPAPPLSSPPTYRHNYTPATVPAPTAPPTITPSTTIAPLGARLPVSPSTLPFATKAQNAHVAPVFAALSGGGFFVALVIMGICYVRSRPAR